MHLSSSILASEQQFSPGEIIFREGDESTCAYRILSGNVEIYKRTERGTVLLAVLDEGDVFGEMGIISDRPRSAYASAKDSVTVQVISRESLGATLHSQPEEITLIIRVLMERLREASQQVSELVSQHHGKMELADPDKIPDINKVTLTAFTDTLKGQMPEHGVVISSFPFRVGSQPEGMPPNPLDWNNLFVQHADPAFISRNHFAIQRGDKGLAVSDRGSKQGTIVNGMAIGGGNPEYKVDLRPGDNEIVAGGEGSPVPVLRALGVANIT